MKRLKGPDLKMPKLKVPDFLVDLYWDLRDRHLLPLVALGIVAIVAVPFLLGGDSEEAPAPAGGAGASALEAHGDAPSLTVVEAKPGLRDYRKRLKGRSASDPFEQRYTAPQLAGTKLGGGEEGESSSSTTTTTKTKTTKKTKTVKHADGTTTTEVVTDTTDGSGSESQLTLFSFAVDVKVTRTETMADGIKVTSEPVVLHRVVPPSAIPGEKAQVVTYMGISPKTRNPLLLISDDVTAVFGEGHCLSGSSACQLLEVETGLPITFVYGPGNVRYKINVLKVEAVAAG